MSKWTIIISAEVDNTEMLQMEYSNVEEGILAEVGGSITSSAYGVDVVKMSQVPEGNIIAEIEESSYEELGEGGTRQLIAIDDLKEVLSKYGII